MTKPWPDTGLLLANLVHYTHTNALHTHTHTPNTLLSVSLYTDYVPQFTVWQDREVNAKILVF